MKKIFLFSTFILLLFTAIGCEKDEAKKHSECQGYSDAEKKKVFVYNFHPFIEEDETITIYYKAKHSKISAFEDSTVFKYQPNDNFIGIDTVGVVITNKKGQEKYFDMRFHISKCGMLTEMNTNL